MHVIKLREVGGNLSMTIPRALARELGWTYRIAVAVTRDDGGTLHVVNLERHLADTKRLRANPISEPARTESPTARENRP